MVRGQARLVTDAALRADAAANWFFTVADDYQIIDAAKLSATLQREAAAITGPGVVKSVVVTSQAPRRRARGPQVRVAEKH